MASKKPRSYVEACNCGECPGLPLDRPCTKREALAYVEHRYGQVWDRRRVLVEAITKYVWSYTQWVNQRRWRKPMGWTDGPVRLCDLWPAGKGVFPEDAARMRRELIATMERKLSADRTER